MLGDGCLVTTVVSRAEGSHHLVGQVSETGGPPAGVQTQHEGWGLPSSAPHRVPQAPRSPAGPLRTLPRSIKEAWEGRGGEGRGHLTGQRPPCGGPAPPGPWREGQRPPGWAEKVMLPGDGSPSGPAPLLRTRSVSQSQLPEEWPPKVHGEPRAPRQLAPGRETPDHPARSAPPSGPCGQTRVSEKAPGGTRTSPPPLGWFLQVRERLLLITQGRPFLPVFLPDQVKSLLTNSLESCFH